MNLARRGRRPAKCSSPPTNFSTDNSGIISDQAILLTNTTPTSPFVFLSHKGLCLARDGEVDTAHLVLPHRLTASTWDGGDCEQEDVFTKMGRSSELREKEKIPAPSPPC